VTAFGLGPCPSRDLFLPEGIVGKKSSNLVGGGRLSEDARKSGRPSRIVTVITVWLHEVLKISEWKRKGKPHKLLLWKRGVKSPLISNEKDPPTIPTKEPPIRLSNRSELSFGAFVTCSGDKRKFRKG